MKAKTEAKSKTEAEAKAKSKEPAGLILGLRWSPSDFRNRRCRWYERRKRRRGKPRRRESGGKPPHSKYGVCCHLRCGFYGAGGCARGTGAAQLRDCASRRDAAAAQGGGGKRSCFASWNRTGHDGIASRGFLRGAGSSAFAGAGKNGACGFDGSGVVRFAACGRYGAGHDCARPCRAGFPVGRGGNYRRTMDLARLATWTRCTCGDRFESRNRDSCGARVCGGYFDSRWRGIETVGRLACKR